MDPRIGIDLERERVTLWREWATLRQSRGKDPSIGLLDAEAALMIVPCEPEVEIQPLPRSMLLRDANALHAETVAAEDLTILEVYRFVLAQERKHARGGVS